MVMKWIPIQWYDCCSDKNGGKKKKKQGRKVRGREGENEFKPPGL